MTPLYLVYCTLIACSGRGTLTSYTWRKLGRSIRLPVGCSTRGLLRVTQFASCAQSIFAPFWIFAPIFKKIIDFLIVHWIVRTLRSDPRCRQMEPKFRNFFWMEKLPDPPLGAGAFAQPKAFARADAFGIRIIAPTLILGSYQFCPQQAPVLYRLCYDRLPCNMPRTICFWSELMRKRPCCFVKGTHSIPLTGAFLLEKMSAKCIADVAGTTARNRR